MEKTYKLQLWLIAIGVLILAIVGIAGFFMSLQEQVSLGPPTDSAQDAILAGELPTEESMITCPGRCWYAWEDCMDQVVLPGCIDNNFRAYKACYIKTGGDPDGQCMASYIHDWVPPPPGCLDFTETIDRIGNCDQRWVECIADCMAMQ